ncbi:hypothetical protein NHX12_012845, partial [Muraenolepis orangiensis]
RRLRGSQRQSDVPSDDTPHGLIPEPESRAVKATPSRWSSQSTGPARNVFCSPQL